jgi:hypothetical protein
MFTSALNEMTNVPPYCGVSVVAVVVVGLDVAGVVVAAAVVEVVFAPQPGISNNKTMLNATAR